MESKGIEVGGNSDRKHWNSESEGSYFLSCENVYI